MKKLILILWLGVCFTQTADVDNKSSSNFISLGGGYAYYSESLEDGSPQHDPMPVISFDRRF